VTLRPAREAIERELHRRVDHGHAAAAGVHREDLVVRLEKLTTSRWNAIRSGRASGRVSVSAVFLRM
jgi:hypothetical protein